ncbi:sulfur carrier protein ThiS [Euzebya sp.]|uniref:sulfur carrier protein ThiS n=1 Tax=Euzebya sp. TaxID=1971409 RepID=UPI00351397D5
MTITLNGTETDLDAGTTLDVVIARLGHDPSRPGVAVAVDGDVVRRGQWATTALTGGETVEVLTAVQGGAR